MREEGSAINNRPTDLAEQRLRDALHARAEQVQPEPPRYRPLSATWRRRERKRRLILAGLTTLVFAAADAVGLWALNHADTESHVIFSDTAEPGGQGSLGRLGQP